MKIQKVVFGLMQIIRDKMVNLEPPLLKEIADTTLSVVDDLDEDDSDELEFDTDDTIVQPLDGIMIWKDEEEVRLLCFYYKPYIDHEENEKMKCKAICELRSSRSTFIDFAQQITEAAQNLKKRKIATDDKLQQEKLPMFG